MSHFFGHGRFETLGDPDDVRMNRRVLWKTTAWMHDSIPTTFSSRNAYWLSGFERATGRAALISPRDYAFHWKSDLDTEAVARRIQRLALPGIVPILHVGGGIVFADVPPAQPHPTLAFAQAAKLAFDVAEKTAQLHAAGCGQLAFGPSNLRLVQAHGEWNMHWIVPGVSALDAYDRLEALPRKDREAEIHHARWDYELTDAITRDIWRIADFFFSLLAPKERVASAAGGDNSFGEPYSTLDVASAFTLVQRISNEGPKAVHLEDVATLARALAVLARVPREVANAVPVVRSLPKVFPDWDDVITEGEAMLESGKHYKEATRLTLAGAYHQRASRSWAQGNLVKALEDVDKAITHDPFFTYQTTRAILLDALKRHDEARAILDTSMQNPPPVGENPEQWGRRSDAITAKEMSRAYLARGFLHWRAGRLQEALADVRQAQKLHASQEAHHALERLQRRVGGGR